jgi:hypothetical protein
MSLGHGAKIVKDQLRCLIDPGNPKCLTATSNLAYDLSGNGFHGILRNQTGAQTALGSMPGVLEYDTGDVRVPCLNFVGLGDATQGYLQFSNHPCGGYTAYTVEAMFKIVSTTPSANYNVIFYSTHADTGDQEFGLMAQDSIADADVAIEINNAYTGGSSNIRATLGWHHFALTFTGALSTVYIDGNSVYTKADSNEVLETTGWNWIGVGQWANSSYNGANGYTQGKLGYLSLYGKALSATEVRQNFEATRGRYGI